VEEKAGRKLEGGQMGFVDPQNRVFGLAMYQGLLKILPVDGSGGVRSFTLGGSSANFSTNSVHSSKGKAKSKSVSQYDLPPPFTIR
jgi:hypothetical protein